MLGTNGPLPVLPAWFKALIANDVIDYGLKDGEVIRSWRLDDGCRRKCEKVEQVMLRAGRLKIPGMLEIDEAIVFGLSVCLEGTIGVNMITPPVMDIGRWTGRFRRK